ncbi:MAG: DnaJ domain-containing protein [Gammaproteobacteria bacterium]|nr:DnaJ domain-containing protein [Gammaproteobacteria bacterium]
MTYPSIQRLQQQLEQKLRTHPEGMSEHTLIKQLQAGDEPALHHVKLSQPLALFQIHFIIFHALYRLRDQLWQQQQGHLEVGPLRIRLLPYHAGQQKLSPHDPLRDYYLELNNLEATDKQDVDELLTAFWRKLGSGNGRKTALDELGLSDPVDDATIKQTWRQLVMQHHPDRGGDKAKLQIINAAMDWLRKP